MTARSDMAGGAHSAPARRRIYLDQTHLRAHVTGIERVTLDLFAPDRLAPHAVRPVTAGSLPGMIAAQQLGLPARALTDRDALFLFPGFPPGPLCAVAASRCLLYVHDTFLLTRKEDLSLRSRLYMSPSFALALRWCPNLFVNSRTTGADVRALCAKRARVALLRPPSATPSAWATCRDRRPMRPAGRCGSWPSAPSSRARTIRRPSRSRRR
ncbi:hypothetical protein R1A27_20880 [Methylobacterium sp. NMS12]|uniref:hypothetical protein n=1 Tax=Methylobacterium sp. NMS12 TaxID=3079766 RepID=UPI003F882D45